MFYLDFHSFVLAQVFGMYLIIMAIIFASRASFYRPMIKKLKPDNGSIVVAASFGLLLGLALVTIHNLWELHPIVLVTILGWLILIKSILWLGFPEKMLRLAQKIYSGAGYYVIAGLSAIFGILLMGKGFSWLI